MSIRFEAHIDLFIEVDLPDEFFIDEVTGHPLTAAEYITRHLEEYREQIAKADGRCTQAIAMEEDEMYKEVKQ